MSKQEYIAAGCEGKHKHNRKTAMTVAKRARGKGQAVEAYRCTFCGSWHVGHAKKREHRETWTPRPESERDRPTPERRSKGEWTWVTTDRAGQKAAKDVKANPIDALEHSGALSSDQASAARDFELLYHRAKATPGIRDSTTLWEPKGFESDDGDIVAERDRRELYLFLGIVRDRQLRHVCVEHNEPRPDQVGLLREALNECARFFGYGKRRS